MIILIIAAVVASRATKGPKKISDQFVNAIQAGDTAATFGLTGTIFQEPTSQQQLDTFIKQTGPAIKVGEAVIG